MAKSAKEVLVIYIPLTVGVAVFGVLGIYIEIAIVQGFNAANEWLFTLRGYYPEGMLGKDGYTPIGNYIGLFVGILLGWWFAKYVLAPRILGEDYSRNS